RMMVGYTIGHINAVCGWLCANDGGVYSCFYRVEMLYSTLVSLQGSGMTIFYLVRHGETAWNIQGRWQGHTDIALNAAGYAQAQLLAQRLHDEGSHFDVIYSSDLQRAWETASAVGAAL